MAIGCASVRRVSQTPEQGHSGDMRRWRLRNLASFRARRTPHSEDVPEKSPEELRQERDLLERVQAGIALNKLPPR
jgi:hypothetical protein